MPSDTLGIPCPPDGVCCRQHNASGTGYANDPAWLPRGWQTSYRPKRDDVESALDWLAYQVLYAKWRATRVATQTGDDEAGAIVGDAFLLFCHVKKLRRFRGGPAESKDGPFGWLGVAERVGAISAFLIAQLARQEPKRRLSVHEANQTVGTLLRTRSKRGRPISASELAKKVGCSKSLVLKTPVWKAYQQKLEKLGTKKSLGPKTVALTDDILASTGRYDAKLQDLIHEQEEDRIADARGYPQRREL